MMQIDETLPKDTDEAQGDAEKGKEDKVADVAQEEEKKIILAKEAEKPNISIQPLFPRRMARNMEAKGMSELLKVLKEEESGIFLIPSDIENKKISSVMLNMEDSCNVMSLTMYQNLKIDSLKSTRAMVRLVDMSRAYPVGIAKCVLVKVKDLVLRKDFFVLNMGNLQTHLGRPFLEAARDQIDCDAGKPTSQEDGETLASYLLKVEEQPRGLEIVDFEDISKQIVEGILPQGIIQDPLGQDATDWTLANIKSISPTEVQHHILLGGAVPAEDPQRELDMTKKLLALVIMRLNSICQKKSPVHAMPKTSDTKVV